MSENNKLYHIKLKTQDISFDEDQYRIKHMDVECDVRASSFVDACTLVQSHFSMLFKRPMEVDSGYEYDDPENEIAEDRHI